MLALVWNSHVETNVASLVQTPNSVTMKKPPPSTARAGVGPARTWHGPHGAEGVGVGPNLES